MAQCTDRMDGMDRDQIRNAIEQGNTALGIEFGSTRIKAVLVDGKNKPIAQGSYDWENRFEEGIWTYRLADAQTGLISCFRSLKEDVNKKYDITLHTIGAMGVSAMMHGYMAFYQNQKLLVPFRTWRNTMTAAASQKLTEIFHFPIPQRWSIAHLYQAILNGEKHVDQIRYLTTLDGYIHWKLTGQKVIGIGQASGMFPIDTEQKDYRKDLAERFDQLVADKKYPWKVLDILPEVRSAGVPAGTLTEEGAAFLDPDGDLRAGIPMCPPEGDAGTGMVATNSVEPGTGNVSAGTSIFSMVVLEHPLSGVYPELDLVTTPEGEPVAMVHCNNCTSDLNAWVNMFREAAELFGCEVTADDLYGRLFRKAMESKTDCKGLLSYCYLSGEHITGMEEGRPLFARTPDSELHLSDFMRVQMYASMATLRMGMDILVQKEGICLARMLGHGGFFKTQGVGQKMMSDALNVPVTVMETAGEGGAWGMAILASFRRDNHNLGLAKYLNGHVFQDTRTLTEVPDKEGHLGFEQFMARFREGLYIERAAVKYLKV